MEQSLYSVSSHSPFILLLQRTPLGLELENTLSKAYRETPFLATLPCLTEVCTSHCNQHITRLKLCCGTYFPRLCRMALNIFSHLLSFQPAASTQSLQYMWGSSINGCLKLALSLKRSRGKALLMSGGCLMMEVSHSEVFSTAEKEKPVQPKKEKRIS